ncbi:aminotransferase [Mycobacteroides abscessus subsp. abscessus]|nr:aminotransferase [Mycobacteroides abscessus subsp. abscessus]
MLGLKATELAYTVGVPWLKEFKELIWHNHQELKRYLNQELPEVTVFDLEGTFLQWLDFNAFGLSASELEEVMHKEALVFGDEGYIFGTEGNGFERLNLAVPTKILMDALERLVHTMKKYR